MEIQELNYLNTIADSPVCGGAFTWASTSGSSSSKGFSFSKVQVTAISFPGGRFAGSLATSTVGSKGGTVYSSSSSISGS